MLKQEEVKTRVDFFSSFFKKEETANKDEYSICVCAKCFFFCVYKYVKISEGKIRKL